MAGAKYRDILEQNLFQSACDLRLRQRFTFLQDNDPKHKAKATLEWYKGKLEQFCLEEVTSNYCCPKGGSTKY